MNKNFQIITTGLFIFFIVLGVTLFALNRSGSGAEKTKMSVWGVYDKNIFNLVVKEFEENKEAPFEIKYTQFDEDNFDAELVEALASNEGPDAVILSQERILKHSKRILGLPFSSFPEREFKDKYLEVAEKLIVNNTIMAIPFSVDPLVMYWNRDVMSDIGRVNAPEYWDEIFTVTKNIVRKDNAGNILKSAIAMGEYDNIYNAKDILSALIIQSGNPIVDSRDGKIESVLEKTYDNILNPAEASLRFYTEFSNPSKEVYTWNRSFKNSRDEFIAGNLAIYFGFAGELKTLREKNPNLNFDVAKIPQSRDSGHEKTFANLNSFAVLKNSPQINSVFKVIFIMSSPTAIEMFANLSGTPPVSKALILEKQEDSYKDVFYKSAIISSTWLDPDPLGSESIYEGMIENVTSGKLRVSEAVSRASKELQGLINKLK